MTAKSAGRLQAVARPSQFLPYGRQFIDDDDIAAVTDVLRSERLTTGPAVERFESALREATGASHAVACVNGTAALHLAVCALGLDAQATVIVPAVTFAATANAARYAGARVRFADVDPDTGLMRPCDLEAALAQGRADAVFPVHLGGQTVDPAACARIADDAGLAIVEDACHALGTRYIADFKTETVGGCAHADVTVFSFHAVKTVAMGEGGALTTRDEKIAARLRRLRNHGAVRESDAFASPLAFDSKGRPNPWYYELTELGFNYRASDIACALGASQLRKLGRFVQARQRLVDRYALRLAPLAPAVRPVPRMHGCTPAWHLMAVLIDFEALGIERGELMRRLMERGIGTQVHYVPLHLQPYYRALRAQWGDTTPLPGAEAYYARCLSLPLFVGMTEDDVDRAVDALIDSVDAC